MSNDIIVMRKTTLGSVEVFTGYKIFADAEKATEFAIKSCKNSKCQDQHRYMILDLNLMEEMADE